MECRTLLVQPRLADRVISAGMAIMAARWSIIVRPVHRMALVADGDIGRQAIMRGGAVGPGLAGGDLAAGRAEMAG